MRTVGIVLFLIGMVFVAGAFACYFYIGKKEKKIPFSHRESLSGTVTLGENNPVLCVQLPNFTRFQIVVGVVEPKDQTIYAVYLREQSWSGVATTSKVEKNVPRVVWNIKINNTSSYYDVYVAPYKPYSYPRPDIVIKYEIDSSEFPMRTMYTYEYIEYKPYIDLALPFGVVGAVLCAVGILAIKYEQ